MPVRNEVQRVLAHHPIFSCEGTGEQVAIEKLVSEDLLVFPRESVVEITRKRKSVDIQEQFLGFEYDWPVCVVRVLDSPRERFRLGQLYSKRFPVISIYTRPEIEMLTIIREGRYASYVRKKSSMKPSEFCKRDLGLAEIKSRDFLDSYWTADALTSAAREYRRLSHRAPGELFIADIIRE